MTNSQKGEVSLDGPDGALVLRFGTNALVELEERLNKPMAEIIGSVADPDSMRLGTMRAIVWAGLGGNDPRPTIEQVGDLIDALGMDVIGEKIGEAFNAAFPDADGNPPKAGRAGTGKTS